jgi:hypothetical protein
VEGRAEDLLVDGVDGALVEAVGAAPEADVPVDALVLDRRDDEPLEAAGEGGAVGGGEAAQHGLEPLLAEAAELGDDGAARVGEVDLGLAAIGDARVTSLVEAG